jgi:histidinol-phosphatase
VSASVLTLDLAHALSVAKQAAAAAAVVIARYYGNAVVTIKPDHTPVTQADIESELAIKTVLKAHFPDHGFYGEETAAERMDAEYLWLIDPIDGTKSFIRNYPIFSTQIALMHDGQLVLGVSSASEFGELAWAYQGGGAWLNGKQIHLAQTHDLAQAILSTGNIKTLSRGPRWQILAQLLQGASRTRGYGDFYHYHLLAKGSIDLVIESDVNILDVAALAVIVREAGGVFTDLEGAQLDLNTRSVLAGAPALHKLALAAFCQ